MNALEEMPKCGTPVLHWFAASVTEMERTARLGCWFSVGPAMLIDARGRDLVARMPRDNRVVAETDGPYADLRGRPLMPWHVETVAKDCGRLLGVSEDEAVRQFDSNAAALRGLAPW